MALALSIFELAMVSKQHANQLFSEAVEANKDKVFRICLSYSESREDAEDLFQEVLLNVWKALPSFKGASSIDTWVYRITLNICIRARHLTAKRTRHMIRVDGITLENTGESVAESREEDFALLSACIDKLKGSEKSIILLYLEDLTYKDIAEVIVITENHVAVKIKRIKEKLIKCVKP